MTVRVRFAPSPTGHLHIGGARTALYNFIFSKAMGGTYILRVEDTDQERSSKDFEASQLDDLTWLGLAHQEGPGVGGDYGPYHQSERLEIYKKYAEQLLDNGKAFYDFCTATELEDMACKNKQEGTPPYTGKWKDPNYWDEAKKRVLAGEQAPIRFLVPEMDMCFKDYVRGEVSFPKGMVGDFVILRSNGTPTYNFCNVIDDHLQKITHVIRGEDHLNNTLRQMMIYEAIGAKAPEFAHVSLLIGKDRQKLSKRHGATSVKQYRKEGYLPEALTNYLCLLGWSHPEEKDVFELSDIAHKNIFTLNRFSKSHAIYDIDKLKYINAQHLKNMDLETFQKRAGPFITEDSFYYQQSTEWKKNFLGLFQDKIQLFPELNDKLFTLLNETIEHTDELKDVLQWETTPAIKAYILEQLEGTSDTMVSAETFDEWMKHCKKELKVKGKALFMGLRVVLTGQNHGPDLKVLIPLTPVTILKRRLANL